MNLLLSSREMTLDWAETDGVETTAGYLSEREAFVSNHCAAFQDGRWPTRVQS